MIFTDPIAFDTNSLAKTKLKVRQDENTLSRALYKFLLDT